MYGVRRRDALVGRELDELRRSSNREWVSKESTPFFSRSRTRQELSSRSSVSLQSGAGLIAIGAGVGRLTGLSATARSKWVSASAMRPCDASAMPRLLCASAQSGPDLQRRLESRRRAGEVLILQQDGADVVDRFRLRRRDRHGALEMRHALRRAARRRTACCRDCDARAPSDRRSPARRGIRRSRRRHRPCCASAMPRLLCASTEFGVDCERRAEARRRIAGLALLEQRVGEVVARAGEVGLELERLPVARHRFVEPAGARAAPRRGCCRPGA